MTTRQIVESRLRDALEQVAAATDVGERPALDHLNNELGTDGRSAHASRQEGRVGRPSRRRALITVGAVAASVVLLAAVVVLTAEDEPSQVDMATSTTLSDDFSEQMVQIGDTAVRVPMHVARQTSPTQIEDENLPPGVEYREQSQTDTPGRVSIVVGVTRSPTHYRALAARELNGPWGGVPGSLRSHEINGHWVAESSLQGLVPDALPRQFTFAIGDFSVVHVETTLESEIALDFIARIQAPPASTRLQLPCTDAIVVDDVADLQLPVDFMRHPQQGDQSLPGGDERCARVFRSPAGAPPRYVAFVDDIGLTLSNPSSVAANREVRWASLEDGVIGAVVSDGSGTTFGVFAAGLTDDEWLRLADGLAGDARGPVDPSVEIPEHDAECIEEAPGPVSWGGVDIYPSATAHELARRFSLAMLGSDGAVLETVDSPSGCTMIVEHGSSGTAAVDVASADGHLVVTGFRFPSERDADSPPISLRVADDEVRIMFSGSVCPQCEGRVAVRYGRDEATGNLDAGGAAHIQLDRDPDDAGSVLVTVTGPQGEVVESVGVSVPPGDFAAG